MKKIFSALRLLVLCASLSSCSSNNYHFVKKGDEGGISFFRYGKFCGNGYPRFSSLPGTKEREIDLERTLPPEDTIDAVCYSHDKCYNDHGRGNGFCDDAALTTLNALDFDLSEEAGCANLRDDIAMAMLSKPKNYWGEDLDLTHFVSMSIVAPLFTISGAMSKLALISNDDKGYPNSVGTCIGSRGLRQEEVLELFNSHFVEHMKKFRENYQ